MDVTLFGKNLKYLRECKNLILDEVHASIGFARSTWSGYENGKSFPNFKDFLKISEYFGVAESDLLHTDLKESDLIKKETTTKKRNKSDLNSDRISDLNDQKEPQMGMVREAGTQYKRTPLAPQNTDTNTQNTTQVIEAQQATINALQQALSLAQDEIKRLKKSPS